MPEMIARSQLIHETTVRRHLNDWLNGEKLAPENGGSYSHLSEEQTAELITYLTNNLLLTTQAIIERVAEWWGIRYTIPGMTKWLYRNGFSYRKPMGVPHKFSAETQRAFVEAYNALKQKAGNDEPILFIDGVHPTQGIKLAYGWMPAGKKSSASENHRQPYPFEHHGSSETERHREYGGSGVRQHQQGTSKNLMLGNSWREIRSGPKEIVCFLYLMCSQNTQIEQ